MKNTLLLSLVLSLSFAALNSWASPDCSKTKGFISDLKHAPGTPDLSNPIKHIVVLMQENHSFDMNFGRLNVNGYGPEVDGINPAMRNPDEKSNPVYVYHSKTFCPEDPDHTWDALHADWDNGKNDGFFKRNNQPAGMGYRVMAYYEPEDIPYYYGLANTFAIADHYFASVMSQTFPNRFYLMAGTSFGHVKNDIPDINSSQPTIFDLMTSNHVTWKYYATDLPYLALFPNTYFKNLDKIAHIAQFGQDVESGNLPSVSFLESSVFLSDEHPPGNVQIGQALVANRVNKILQSRYWNDTVVFITYDENGGFYDHVPPPEACKPDEIPPNLGSSLYGGDFGQYGFRVPFIAVSPFAKRHYVSHLVHDHTSILKFIETKFNLPALTIRDANADGLQDLFDFEHPRYDIPPLPKADLDWNQLVSCLKPHGSLMENLKKIFEALKP